MPNDVCRRTFAEKDFPYSRVAVASPHPDDSVLGCGALMHKLRKARPELEIHCLVMTSGFRGVEDEFLRRHPRALKDGMRSWLGLDVGGLASRDELCDAVRRAVEEQLGADVFARFGTEGQNERPGDIERMLNVFRTAVRREESRREAAELRLIWKRSGIF